MFGLSFFVKSIMLGVGLAMDAFSVSLANGLNEPCMKKTKMLGVTGTFGIFQGLMPLIGWVCVHTFVQYFSAFEKYIPWIALVLLLYIGGKMFIDGIRNKDSSCEERAAGVGMILMQGLATSIDALSVGFTIADYNFAQAAVCALIIGLLTFGICLGGIVIGRKFGTKLAGKAAVFGGAILIIIGIEIFITGIM